ncbi:MAG: hypothetical protein J07AB43_05100 [Candidatus Nanosalina sp. J07AB43]|jgi:hypothetical protein|nr:MAG: hypothetical protein J07AB43_05100 [Candidatus Nanosalina sp. J07AB43]
MTELGQGTVEAKKSLIEQIYGEKLYEYEELVEAAIVVHPGCYLQDNQSFPEELSMRDYAEYDRDLSRMFEELEENTEIYVLYPGRQEGRTREFMDIESRAIEEMNFIPSSLQSGRPLAGEEERYARIFKGLNDHSVVRILGEYEGLCKQNVEELARAIEEDYPADFDVESDVSFPSRSLDRAEGVLYWKDEEPPAYIKALYKTLY